MKPFNLEQCLSGKPCITETKEYKNLKFHSLVNNYVYPLVMVTENGMKIAYTLKGYKDDLDLFMQEDSDLEDPSSLINKECKFRVHSDLNTIKSCLKSIEFILGIKE